MTGLPGSTPSAQGLDARGVLGLIDALEAHPAIDPHSLMVLRHGHVVAQGWWRPYAPHRPHLMYSLSKSFTATALGLAVGEGLLDLDAPAVGYLPGITDVHPRLAGATLRQFVSMRSGHRNDTWMAADEAGGDPLEEFFRLPPEDEPGTTFCYNQPPIMTVSAVIQAVTGDTLTQFLRPRLFDPLGISTAAWLQDPPGRDVGFSGLFTTTDAIARLGQLFLDDGTWQGRRILPEGWTALASRPHADTSGEPFPDWQQGYGFCFWMGRDGYRGDGAWGQFCLVLPEHDTVVAITSATGLMQAVLDAVHTHLLPALGVAAPDERADTELAERLAALDLPTAPGTRWHATPEPGAFTPAGGRCGAQPSLTGVELTDTGLVLIEGGERSTIGFEPDAADVLAVAAAGRVEPTTDVLDVFFVQSPHRLWVTLDRRGNTFTAGWRTQPLHADRLADLGAPAPGPAHSHP